MKGAWIEIGKEYEEDKRNINSLRNLNTESIVALKNNLYLQVF
jgi:hypothetical protein